MNDDDDIDENMKKAMDNLEDGLGLAKKLIESDSTPALNEVAMLNIVRQLEITVTATFQNLKSVYDEALKTKPDVCEMIEAEMGKLGQPLVEIQLGMLSAQAKLVAVGGQFTEIINKALPKLRNR